MRTAWPTSASVVETIYEETVLDVAAPIGSAADTGPSDASAVPELSPSLLSDAWEPAIVVDYPVEPSEDHSDGDVEVPEGSDDPGRPEPAVAGDDRRDEAASLVDAVLFGDSPTETRTPDEPAVDAAGGGRAEPAADVHRPAPTEPEEQLLPLDVPDQPTPATATQAAAPQARVSAQLGRDRVRRSEGEVTRPAADGVRGPGRWRAGGPGR